MRLGWPAAVAITVVGLAAFVPLGGAGRRPPVVLLPLLVLAAAVRAGLGWDSCWRGAARI